MWSGSTWAVSVLAVLGLKHFTPLLPEMYLLFLQGVFPFYQASFVFSFCICNPVAVSTLAFTADLSWIFLWGGVFDPALFIDADFRPSRSQSLYNYAPHTFKEGICSDIQGIRLHSTYHITIFWIGWTK